ncbi:MAG: hypothetical protein IJG45_00640 [Oscillospiraceae bacterium]|nr:hypothetical protein [Oscillospiraceae bacterium]
MVIAVFGESCTGKSTLVDALKEKLSAEVYTGKDYLRLHGNEAMAQRLFSKKLTEAVNGENIIFVLTEPELLQMVPSGAYRILVTEELDVIKERFAARMRGVLPPPVSMMLERKHGCFDAEPCDLRVHAGKPTAREVFDIIMKMK